MVVAEPLDEVVEQPTEAFDVAEMLAAEEAEECRQAEEPVDETPLRRTASTTSSRRRSSR